MKLQICKKEKWGKKYRWRLNNMLLNSQWIEEEIKQEIKNFQASGNENTTFQNQWNAAKAVRRGKFIATQASLKKLE